MGEYNKSKIIRYSRLYNNLTQEKLAEGICDPFTLAKYESGIIEPSELNYYCLMRRLGNNESLYRIPGDFFSRELAKIRIDINTKTQQRDNEGLQRLVEEYESKMDQTTDNVQYATRVRLFLDCEIGKISGEEYIEKQLENLRLSYNDIDLLNLQHGRMYSEVEIMLLNSLIVGIWINGDIDKALLICSEVVGCLEDDILIGDSKDKEKIYLNYSNMLGLKGMHEESIEACKKGIAHLKERGRCNLLYNFYFNIGWNFACMSKLDADKKEELVKKAKMYYWIALKLCKLFPEDLDSITVIQTELRNLLLEERSDKRIS